MNTAPYIPSQFKQIPGWLNLLQDYGEYTPEELIAIEEADDLERIALSEAEKYYKSVEVPKVRKLIAEHRQEHEQEYYDCRIRFLVGGKKELFQKRAKLSAIFTKMCQEGNPLEEKKQVRDMIAGVDKKIKGLQQGINVLCGKEQGIDDEMIARAKEYPIGSLIEVDSRGFALCVNHKDTKPSMFCKNNYAHCFTCGYTADSIKIAMDTKGINFIEAVKTLNL